MRAHDLPVKGAKIPVYRRDQVITWTLVDWADFKWLSHWKWHFRHDRRKDLFYVTRQQKNFPTTIYLHREILGLKYNDGLLGDHINGNTFDNRRKNLRTLTKAQSAQNVRGHRKSTSSFRGVSLETRSGKWVACVKLNGRNIFLGYFNDEEKAAQVALDFRLEHMPYAIDR